LADLATQSTRPNSADQTTRELTWWRTQGAQRIGIAAFILFAYLQTIGLQGRPGIMWMNIYFPEDLLSLNLSEILDFFRDLRTGIPPAQALVEIGTLQYAGGDGLRVLMGDLYRLSLIASYVIAIRLSSGQSRLQSLLFWAALVLSAIFLRSTVLIHPQNAQLTDVVYPALIVLFVALLSKAIRNHQYPAAAAYALLSGLCLSLAELTRPFVLLLLPVIVIGGAAALFRRRDLSPRRRAALACLFLAPLLILSGGWHLKLASLNGGQIFWSNYSGYNLANAWPPLERSISTEGLPGGPDPPLRSDRWENRNTQGTYEASAELQRRWLHDIVLAQPAYTAAHSFYRIWDLLSVHTSAISIQNKPELTDPIFPFYRTGVWLCCVVLLLRIALLVRQIASARSLLPLATPSSLLALVTLGSIVLTAIGDHAEEGRFLIMLLPCFVALLTVDSSTSALPHRARPTWVMPWRSVRTWTR